MEKRRFILSLFLAFLLLLSFVYAQEEQEDIFYPRGDANADGIVDINDANAILNHLFRGGTISCIKAADAVNDGRIDMNDAVRILNYLFNEGLPPRGGDVDIQLCDDPTYLDEPIFYDRERGLAWPDRIGLGADPRQLRDAINGMIKERKRIEKLKEEERKIYEEETEEILYGFMIEAYEMGLLPVQYGDGVDHTETLVTCLDALGILDPTPICDLTSISLTCEEDSWLSFLGKCGLAAIPIVGDLRKLSKVKNIVFIENVRRVDNVVVAVEKHKSYLYSTSTIRNAYDNLKRGLSKKQFWKRTFTLFDRVNKQHPSRIMELMTGRNGNHIINLNLNTYIGPKVYQVGYGNNMRLGFMYLSYTAEEIANNPSLKDRVRILFLYLTDHNDQHGAIDSLKRYLKEVFPEFFNGHLSYNSPPCEDEDLTCLCSGFTIEEMPRYCTDPPSGIPIPNPGLVFGIHPDNTPEDILYPKRNAAGEVELRNGGGAPQPQSPDGNEFDPVEDDILYCPSFVDCPDCDESTSIDLQEDDISLMFDPTVSASSPRANQYPYGESVWPWQSGFQETLNTCCELTMQFATIPELRKECSDSEKTGAIICDGHCDGAASDLAACSSGLPFLGLLRCEFKLVNIYNPEFGREPDTITEIDPVTGEERTRVVHHPEVSVPGCYPTTYAECGCGCIDTSDF